MHRMTKDTFRVLYDQEEVYELTKNHRENDKGDGVMGTCRKCQVIPCVPCYHLKIF